MTQYYTPYTEGMPDLDPQTGCMMSVITILSIALAILAGVLFGS